MFLYFNYSTLHKSTEEDIRDKSSTVEDGINATEPLGESMMIGGSFVGGVAEGVADTPGGMEEVGVGTVGEVYIQ